MSGNDKKPTLKLPLEGEPAETKTHGNENTASTPILPVPVRNYNAFVASALSEGGVNAITGKELVALLELKDGRELTKLVERERKAGIPICASVDNRKPGYYLAAEPSEFARYIKSLDRRLKNISRTRASCEATLNQWTGQAQMEGF